MRLLSFDALRTMGVPGVTHLKPELMFQRRDEILAADWVLFPQYWQVNTLVYGLRRRIFPSANSYHLGHDKVEMTRSFWAVALQHVPHTLIRRADDRAFDEILESIGLPVVVKDIRHSQGHGVHLLESRTALRDHLARCEMVYAQERLPIDRDLRVVWVGDRVVDAYWRIARDGEFHNNVARGGRILFDDIPPAAVGLVERVALELGIDHAGFDIAMVDGHPYLLEFNTLFGAEALRGRGVSLGRIILEYLQKYSTPPFDLPPAATSATSPSLRRSRRAA